MREGRSITNAASILDQLGMKWGHFSSPKKSLNFAFGDIFSIFLTQGTKPLSFIVLKFFILKTEIFLLWLRLRIDAFVYDWRDR